MPKFCANLTMLYNEVDFLGRFEAAAKSGFKGVEYLFPYAYPAAQLRERLFGTIIPDAIIERLEAAVDPATEGRRICVELMQEMAKIPGVAGVHIMAPGNEAAVADVIRDVR